jgi:hypothetical protein
LFVIRAVRLSMFSVIQRRQGLVGDAPAVVDRLDGQRFESPCAIRDRSAPLVLARPHTCMDIQVRPAPVKTPK